MFLLRFKAQILASFPKVFTWGNIIDFSTYNGIVFAVNYSDPKSIRDSPLYPWEAPRNQC